MLWLKACPRCSGDLFLDYDQYGWYKACLQCGHFVDEKDEKSTVAVASKEAEDRQVVAVGGKGRRR